VIEVVVRFSVVVSQLAGVDQTNLGRLFAYFVDFVLFGVFKVFGVFDGHLTFGVEVDVNQVGFPLLQFSLPVPEYANLLRFLMWIQSQHVLNVENAFDFAFNENLVFGVAFEADGADLLVFNPAEVHETLHVHQFQVVAVEPFHRVAHQCLRNRAGQGLYYKVFVDMLQSFGRFCVCVWII